VQREVPQPRSVGWLAGAAPSLPSPTPPAAAGSTRLGGSRCSPLQHRERCPGTAPAPLRRAAREERSRALTRVSKQPASVPGAGTGLTPAPQATSRGRARRWTFGDRSAAGKGKLPSLLAENNKPKLYRIITAHQCVTL